MHQSPSKNTPYQSAEFSEYVGATVVRDKLFSRELSRSNNSLEVGRNVNIYPTISFLADFPSFINVYPSNNASNFFFAIASRWQPRPMPFGGKISENNPFSKGEWTALHSTATNVLICDESPCVWLYDNTTIIVECTFTLLWNSHSIVLYVCEYPQNCLSSCFASFGCISMLASFHFWSVIWILLSFFDFTLMPLRRIWKLLPDSFRAFLLSWKESHSSIFYS